ncbi:MAG: hypothetical protein FGM24_03850 [Candidatus Kapabacteria bacterium]|nr:hypothetical protein [Candidatus Kapabacteria bacterium]
MDTVRRIAAVVMLICIALPQRACESTGKVTVYYPLTDVTDALSILGIVAVFAIPVILLALRIRPPYDQLLGIGVAIIGLWHEGYQALQISSYVMVGWYLYIAAALAYIVTSIMVLLRRRHDIDPPGNILQERP